MGTSLVFKFEADSVWGTILNLRGHRDQTDTAYGRVTVHARVYLFDDVWVEVSLSTKAANESTSSSGGVSVFDSSPGLYFPVFTKQKGANQSTVARKASMRDA